MKKINLTFVAGFMVLYLTGTFTFGLLAGTLTAVTLWGKVDPLTAFAVCFIVTSCVCPFFTVMLMEIDEKV